MIDVYTWPTPNGHKVHIMLEECGLPYAVHAVDIGAGDQFKPEFLAISPNNKIPAIVDSDGPDGKPIALFESGAILIYLAGKSGRFLPEDTRDKYVALQWLMFQKGHVGPMLGQAHHFRLYAPEKIEYAVNRYTNEAKRLYGVMDRRLAGGRVLRRQLLDRRHCDLPLDALAREPGRRSRRVSEFQALVRRHRGAPRGAARRSSAGEPPKAHHRRQGTRRAVRRPAVRPALKRRPAS